MLNRALIREVSFYLNKFIMFRESLKLFKYLPYLLKILRKKKKNKNTSRYRLIVQQKEQHTQTVDIRFININTPKIKVLLCFVLMNKIRITKLTVLNITRNTLYV